MIHLFLRRLLSVVPILFGVTLLLFILFNVVGGDPTYQMLGKNASATQIAELRHELGLDQPKWRQYVRYLGQVVTFDYGRSYSTKQSISDMISMGVGPSLMLAVPAFFLTLIVAVSVALLAAYFRGRWIDRLVVVLCVLGMSLPSLALILFGQYQLAYKMGWFPISGYVSEFPAAMGYVALPALIWMMVSLGVDVRFFRTAILDETGQDYVRTARAKGLAEHVVYFRHVLKNSLIPIVTYVVIEIPFLLMGSLLLESFFGIPGLGSITIDAINNSDYPVLKAMTTVNSLLFIAGTFATDVVYLWVDPRVRAR